MNDIYSRIISDIGLSPVNTTLLIIIFVLVKQRLTELESQLMDLIKRNDRVERSLIKVGIDLLERE